MFKILEFIPAGFLSGTWRIRLDEQGNELKFSTIDEVKEEVRKLLNNGKNKNHIKIIKEFEYDIEII
ncbi:hypothetical protein [Caloranaerobacter azorensis]|uniref:Uncharacterized protein n=1 Tax=Caloranaerobacter azorensis TaxID=116090 RepID=A0A6P1YAI8_9FIRM|nr:hypothetical protein [Caloranaerobacter azorensis]QIB26084.1 hypothetical protein G3A45_01420 [Caloranaerobacter azorensis]